MTRAAILRPEPGASATLRRAEAAGLDAFCLPLFTVEPVEWAVPDPARFDALLLTSANAVRCAGPGLDPLAHLPAHAVGAATAAAARERGLRIASTGSGDVAELLGGLDSGLKLLHLAGADRIDPVQHGGPQIEAIVVYRARALEPAPSLADLPDSVVMVHSPRAGRRLDELAARQGLDRSRVAIAAISPAAAAAAGPGWQAIATAAQPGDAALLALAAELCETLGRP